MYLPNFLSSILLGSNLSHFKLLMENNGKSCAITTISRKPVQCVGNFDIITFYWNIIELI